jgi:hypothetical protein
MPPCPLALAVWSSTPHSLRGNLKGVPLKCHVGVHVVRQVRAGRPVCSTSGPHSDELLVYELLDKAEFTLSC